MNLFPWRQRFRDAALAGLAGWAAGYLATIPFEIALAKRYVGENHHLLPQILAEGLLVWGIFTLLLAAAAWGTLVLSVALLVPPRWIVRWRSIVIPGIVAAAIFAAGSRLNLFVKHRYPDLKSVQNAFFTAPNVFAWTYALVLACVYIRLAARRIQPADALDPKIRK